MRPELSGPLSTLAMSGLVLVLVFLSVRFDLPGTRMRRYERMLRALVPPEASAFDSPASIRAMRITRVAGWVLLAASMGLLSTWIVSLSTGRVGLARMTGDLGSVLLPASVLLVWADIYNRRYMAKHFSGSATTRAPRPAGSAADLPKGPALWVRVGAMVLAVIGMGIQFRSWQIALLAAGVFAFFSAPFAILYVRARRRASGH